MLNTLAECYLGDITLTSLSRYSYGNIFMTSLVKEHSRQCVPCFEKNSVTLQIENHSTEASCILKQIFLSHLIYCCIENVKAK